MSETDIKWLDSWQVYNLWCCLQYCFDRVLYRTNGWVNTNSFFQSMNVMSRNSTQFNAHKRFYWVNELMPGSKQQKTHRNWNFFFACLSSTVSHVAWEIISRNCIINLSGSWELWPWFFRCVIYCYAWKTGLLRRTIKQGITSKIFASLWSDTVLFTQ